MNEIKFSNSVTVVDAPLNLKLSHLELLNNNTHAATIILLTLLIPFLFIKLCWRKKYF